MSRLKSEFVSDDKLKLQKLSEPASGIDLAGSTDEKAIPPKTKLKKKKKKKQKKHLDQDKKTKNPEFEIFTNHLSQLRTILLQHDIAPIRFIRHTAQAIEAIRSLHDLNAHLALLLKERFVPEHAVFVELIIKLSQWGNIEQALELYDIGSFYISQPNTRMFNYMLRIAGRNDRVDRAINIYTAAISNGTYDPNTFNYTLDALIRGNEYTIAQVIYSQAIETKKTNLVTHCIAARFMPGIKESLKDNQPIIFDAPDKKKSEPVTVEKFTPISSPKEHIGDDLEKKPKEPPAPISEKDYDKAFSAVKFGEAQIKEAVELRRKGAHVTGKAATFIGLLLFNTIEKAQTIVLNGVDNSYPCSDLKNTQMSLEAKGYMLEKPDEDWLHLCKNVAGMLFDVALFLSEKPKSKLITGINSGHLYIFTPQEMSEQKPGRFIGLKKGGFWFCIDQLDSDFPIFKHACETLEYWLAPYEFGFRNYFTIALKNYRVMLMMQPTTSEPQNNSRSPITQGMISYQQLLFNLDNHFFQELSANDELREEKCYHELFVLLQFATIDNPYLEMHFRAIFRALILTTANNILDNNTPHFSRVMDRLTTRILDSWQKHHENLPSHSETALKSQLTEQTKIILTQSPDLLQELQSLSDVKNIKPEQDVAASSKQLLNSDDNSQTQMTDLLPVKISATQKLHADFKSEKSEEYALPYNHRIHHPLTDFMRIQIITQHAVKTTIEEDPSYFLLIQLANNEMVPTTGDSALELLFALGKNFEITFSILNLLLGIVKSAREYLAKNNRITELEICLKIITAFKQDELASNKMIAKKMDNVIKQLSSAIDQYNPKTIIDSGIVANIDILCHDILKTKTLKSKDAAIYNEILFLKEGLVPFFTNSNQQILNNITSHIDDMFIFVYQSFLYIEKALMTYALEGNNLDFYRNLQERLLEYSLEFLAFLRDCGVNQVKQFVRFSNNLGYFTTNVDFSTGRGKLKLSTLEQTRLTVLSDRDRLEKTQKNNLSLGILIKFLKETGDSVNSSLSLESVYASNLEITSRILRIHELEKQARHSDNAILIPSLHNLIFSIMFNELLNIKNDPILSLTEKIPRIVNLMKHIANSELEQLNNLWGPKKNEPYFKYFKINTALCSLVLGAQRLLLHTLMTLRMIKSKPSIFLTERILANITGLAAAQIQIIAIMEKLGLTHLDEWIFLDRNSRAIKYSIHFIAFQNKFLFDAQAKCALVEPSNVKLTWQKIFYGCMEYRKSLYKDNADCQIILAHTQDLIIRINDELLKSFKLAGAPATDYLSPSCAIWNASGLEDTFNTGVKIARNKIIELFFDLAAEIDESAKKSIAIIESLNKNTNELLADDFPEESEKLATTKPTQDNKAEKKEHKVVSWQTTLPPKPKRAVHTKLSMVAVPEYSSANHEINSQTKKMIDLFNSIMAIIKESPKNASLLRSLSNHTSKIASYTQSPHVELQIRAFWLIRDLYAHAASQFINASRINHSLFKEANYAMQLASQHYHRICDLAAKKRGQYQNLLDLTLIDSTNILDLFNKAKIKLNTNLKAAEDRALEIQDIKGMYWWLHHRWDNGFVDALGRLHPQPVKPDTAYYSSMKDTYYAVEEMINEWTYNAQDIKFQASVKQQEETATSCSTSQQGPSHSSSPGEEKYHTEGALLRLGPGEHKIKPNTNTEFFKLKIKLSKDSPGNNSQNSSSSPPVPD